MALQAFSDEQARVIVNLEQAYQVWIEALRAKNAMPYNMRIKEVSGREYLYEVTDRFGNMKSKGPLNPDRQEEFDEYKLQKSELKNRLTLSKATLKELGSLYRALRLPMLPAQAGRFLREADRLRYLGEQAMVVGTNALIAYALEANAFIRDAPPRWFALQKLWMADKPERNPQKKLKDRKQGIALLNAVWQTMPHYALDACFYEELPDPLKPRFEQWDAQRPKC